VHLRDVFHIGGRVRAVMPMVPLSLHFSNGPLVLLQDVFQIGDRVRSVILSLEDDWSRLSLSTGELEATAGDMLTDPVRCEGSLVYTMLNKWKNLELAATFGDNSPTWCATSVADALGIGSR